MIDKKVLVVSPKDPKPYVEDTPFPAIIKKQFSYNYCQ
jgi:hypothetical protein